MHLCNFWNSNVNITLFFNSYSKSITTYVGNGIDFHGICMSDWLKSYVQLSSIMITVCFWQADNAFFRFVFANLRDYEDIFEISPPAAQGSATATLLVRNSSALDYDRGLREYTLEVSILFQMGHCIVLYSISRRQIQSFLGMSCQYNFFSIACRHCICFFFGHCREKDIFLPIFKIKKSSMPILFDMSVWGGLRMFVITFLTPLLSGYR